MLAEHDRAGPALAADTATFPLHDVNFALSGTSPRITANLCFIRTPSTGPWAVAPTARQTPKDPGGDRRDRTDDLMLAKHALSQLSYVP